MESIFKEKFPKLYDEKAKRTRLRSAERIRNDICSYDEAFSIEEMIEQTGFCSVCTIAKCPINK